MKEKYDISGMTCSNCARHVHDAVSKLDGIKQCDVNLLLNQMTIEKDDKLSSQTIIEAVKNSGYVAKLYDPLSKSKTVDEEYKKQKKTLYLTIFFMFLLSYLAMGSMFNLPQFNILKPDVNPILHSCIQLILMLIIYYLNNARIIGGLKQLIKRQPTMDSLVSLGCLASLLYGLYILAKIVLAQDNMSAYHYTHSLYFETGAMVLTFVSIGKHLEQSSKIKTTSAITHLINIAPQSAILYNDKQEVTIKVEEVKINDLLLIKPGAKIPVDGIVVEGHSFIDSSSLTGESIPVEKNVNDQLLSGSLNLNGTMIMKAESSYKNSTFNKIIELVSEAANSKAPISTLADTISSYFIPFVITISIITFVIWFIISKDFETSLNYSMSVLVVSCPCALGLATPTAIMVSTGKAASNGILFKNAAVIEETSKIDTLVFDKTNTITVGKPFVINENIYDNCDDYYSILNQLEKNSEHPLSLAILNYCKDKNIKDIQLENKEYIVGHGLQADYNGSKFAIGNKKLMNKLKVDTSKVDEGSLSGYTALYYSKDQKLIGLYLIADKLKNGIKDILSQLKDYDIVLLTGDNQKVAENIAEQVNIKHVVANVLPQQKQDVIKDLQLQGKKVAMVGDGINDSVALVQANVGIAINNATDIAVESSDVVLISDKFADLLNSLKLAKYTLRIIKQNLFWALGYNCILIPIAAGALSFINIKLNPMISSLAMSLSSITVISNALRINSFKPYHINENNVEEKMTYKVYIDTMMCSHCQKTVEDALLNIGIVSKTVLDGSYAIIETVDSLDEKKLKEAIENAGYKVTKIEKQ